MSARPPEHPEALKIARCGDRHLRSPQNQNLSKMREVLKYGIFDISSMSTKGFWLTYVKTSFFVYFWDKNAIFLQISFVPYLTSACPAHRLYRTANWSAPLRMFLLTILPPGMASSSKTCWTLLHKCRDTPPGVSVFVVR